MFMRNRYNILFSLFWASLVLVGIETQAQENLKFAPVSYTHLTLPTKLEV